MSERMKKKAQQSMTPIAVAPIDTSSRYRSQASPSGHLRKTPTFSSNQQPTEIIPRLYVSDLSVAENPTILVQLGITHVLSAMQGSVSLPPTLPLSRLQIPLVDSPFAELAEHLPRATSFISDALQDPRARVLVHCAQGISRSASIVCAYLIRAYGWTPAQAVQYVKSKRPSANPNPGFISQLSEFAGTLRAASAGRR